MVRPVYQGQTQVLSTVTLGSFSDVQFIDAIGLEEFKRSCTNTIFRL